MKIILIGDSIRMAYQPLVAELLNGQAEVSGPEDNGGTSDNVLDHLDKWVLTRNPDIVHINCGLHDIKRPIKTGIPYVSPEAYADNLRTIFSRIRNRTGAKLLWASTTAVIEELHRKNKNTDRLEADVVAYNAVAAAVAGEFDIPVNDLYSLVIKTGRKALLTQDGVHFVDEGNKLLGNTVAAFIKSHM